MSTFNQALEHAIRTHEVEHEKMRERVAGTPLEAMLDHDAASVFPDPAERALRNLPLLPTATPVQQQLGVLTRSGHLQAVAADLGALASGMRQCGAELYVGFEWYGNVDLFAGEFVNAVTSDSEHKPDAESEKIKRGLVDIGTKVLQGTLAAYSVSLGHDLVSLTREHHPFFHKHMLRTRFSANTEPSMHPHDIDGHSFRQIALAPTTAREALAALDTLRKTGSRSIAEGMLGPNIAFGAEVGGDMDAAREMGDVTDDRLVREGIYAPGITGVGHVGIGPKGHVYDGAGTGLLYPTFSESEQAELLGTIQKTLGWRRERFVATWQVFNALNTAYLNAAATNFANTTRYYRHTLLHRLDMLACGGELLHLPTTRCSWERLSDVTETGELAARPTAQPDHERYAEHCVHTGSLPLVLNVEELQKAASDEGDVPLPVAGRLWYDTDGDQWIVFWGSLEMQPAHTVAHSPHKNCPFSVERLSEKTLTARLDAQEWAIV